MNQTKFAVDVITTLLENLHEEEFSKILDPQHLDWTWEELEQDEREKVAEMILEKLEVKVQ